MKIVQIVRSMNPSGGGVREFVLQAGAVLRKLGHDVKDISLDPPDAPWVDDGAGIQGVGRSAAGWGWAPGAAGKILRAAEGFEAMILHGLWQNHGIVGSLAAQRLGIPYVVFAHGMLDPWFQRTFPFKALKKRIYWRMTEHRILERAAALCFSCDEERRLAHGGFRPWRIVEAVVGFGTRDPGNDSAAAQLLAWQGVKPSGLAGDFLVFLGRLHPKKGCDLLVDAYAAWPGRHAVQLCFVGDGDPEFVASLKARAARCGVGERCQFAGPLQGPAKWGALREADAFILPSHQENFGIAVVEALACGVAVLISDKVNIHAEIAADGAGFVADDTVPGTGALLKAWGDLSHGDREGMRRRARASFEKRFDLDANMESLLALLGNAFPNRG